MYEKALEGIKVIELTNSIGGAYCCKLMADLGAKVIKIEKPEVGSSLRDQPPYIGDEKGRNNSVIFKYCNTNKQSLTLNLENDNGIKIFKQLVEVSDILISDVDHKELKAKKIDYSKLEKINPGLVMTSLSPYGESGPYENYKAYPLNVSHLSTMGSIYPMPSADMSRPPVMLGGNFEEYDIGAFAAIGSMGAYIYKKRTSIGQYIELSALETKFFLCDTEICSYPISGYASSREGKLRIENASPIYRCKDGYICPFITQPVEWKRLANMIGRQDLMEAEWYNNKFERTKRINEVISMIQEFVNDKSKQEIDDIAQKFRVPITAVMSPQEVVNSEQFKERGYFVDLKMQNNKSMKFPGAPFIMSKTPFSYERSAPFLGQDNYEILNEEIGLDEGKILVLEKLGVI